jgi:Predicted P-loop ATPase and inactivated derivatives
MHGNSLVPLLVGEQGDGKSTFCRMIIPEEQQIYYTDRVDFTKKEDAVKALSRFILINIDEYDSISKRQTAFLKYMLAL